MKTQTCTICKAEFEPKINRQKYCPECSDAALLAHSRGRRFREKLQGLSAEEKIRAVAEIRAEIKRKAEAKLLMTTKLCTQCNETKPKTEFFSHGTATDGLQARCKTCQNKQQYLAYQQKRQEAERRASAAKRRAELNDADLGDVRETLGTFGQPPRVATICCPECGRKQEKTATRCYKCQSSLILEAHQ